MAVMRRGESEQTQNSVAFFLAHYGGDFPA